MHGVPALRVGDAQFFRTLALGDIDDQAIHPTCRPRPSTRVTRIPDIQGLAATVRPMLRGPPGGFVPEPWTRGSMLARNASRSTTHQFIHGVTHHFAERSIGKISRPCGHVHASPPAPILPSIDARAPAAPGDFGPAATIHLPTQQIARDRDQEQEPQRQHNGQRCQPIGLVGALVRRQPGVGKWARMASRLPGGRDAAMLLMQSPGDQLSISQSALDQVGWRSVISFAGLRTAYIAQRRFQVQRGCPGCRCPCCGGTPTVRFAHDAAVGIQPITLSQRLSSAAATPGRVCQLAPVQVWGRRKAMVRSRASRLPDGR